jgi:hypothetical protein
MKRGLPSLFTGPVTEEREPAFPRLVEPVRSLFELQTKLVTRIINEAESELKKLPRKQRSEETLDKLWLTAHGMPRNKTFSRLDGNRALAQGFGQLRR